MKCISLITFILMQHICMAQVFVNKNSFYSSDKIVLSTETVASSKSNKAVLRFKFIDLNDSTIKYYDANLSSRGYVSNIVTYWPYHSFRSISVMTVPFKVREKNRYGLVTAKADVKNIGLYIPLFIRDIKRYWLDNSVSTHKFGIGFLLAPMAEELNDKNTNKYFNNSNTSYFAFMLSSSVALTYSYKNVTFAIVPIGIDLGIDSAGKEWDHHGNYWFGIGIGIDTKLF